MQSFITKIFHGRYFQGDRSIWMIYFLLCMVSLVEVYSASSRMTFDMPNHWGPVVSHAGTLVLGLFVILLVHNIPCKWFILFPILLIPLAAVAHAVAFLSPSELNGTSRWLNVLGFSFQPSELSKLAVIMGAASILAKAQAEFKVKKRGETRIVVGAVKNGEAKAFKRVAILAGSFIFIIFIDNVSTACMLSLVVFAMMYIAHVPGRLLLKTIVGGMAVVALFVTLLLPLPDDTIKSIPVFKRTLTLKHRILRYTQGSDDINDGMVQVKQMDGTIVLRPMTDKERRQAKVEYLLNDKNSQSTYAAIAVANSNVIGLGPGNSIQRDFLQHAESDFIFAIIVEELGVVGSFVILMLYVMLLLRCGRIAAKCQRFFPAYIVMGFGIMMTLQALVNMGVAVGILPVTGQTLPLISKGGSSVLITSLYIAVILSVSRYAESADKLRRVMEQKQQNTEGAVVAEDGAIVSVNTENDDTDDHETEEYATDGLMV